MNVFKRVERMAKRMKWYDFSIFKVSMLCFALFLVAVLPAFDALAHSVAWHWWLLLGILFAIPLWTKMF